MSMNTGIAFFVDVVFITPTICTVHFMPLPGSQRPQIKVPSTFMSPDPFVFCQTAFYWLLERSFKTSLAEATAIWTANFSDLTALASISDPDINDSAARVRRENSSSPKR